MDEEDAEYVRDITVSHSVTHIHHALTEQKRRLVQEAQLSDSDVKRQKSGCDFYPVRAAGFKRTLAG